MRDWMIEKLDRIKEFGSVVSSGFCNEKLSEGRYSICLECDEFGITGHGNKLLVKRGCNVCKCYMPAKVLFRDAKCPKDYWPAELLENVKRTGHGISGEGTYE